VNFCKKRRLKLKPNNLEGQEANFFFFEGTKIKSWYI
jgi:hypothetical protein